MTNYKFSNPELILPFLLYIFVKKKYRGRGVSSLLQNEYEKICRKLKVQKIVLLTLLSNKKMQKILKKSGYKKGSKFYLYEKKLK